VYVRVRVCVCVCVNRFWVNLPFVQQLSVGGSTVVSLRLK